MSVCQWVRVYMHLFVHLCAYVCTCVCVFVSMRARVCVYSWVSVCVIGLIIIIIIIITTQFTLRQYPKKQLKKYFN